MQESPILAGLCTVCLTELTKTDLKIFYSLHVPFSYGCIIQKRMTCQNGVLFCVLAHCAIRYIPIGFFKEDKKKCSSNKIVNLLPLNLTDGHLHICYNLSCVFLVPTYIIYIHMSCLLSCCI